MFFDKYYNSEFIYLKETRRFSYRTNIRYDSEKIYFYQRGYYFCSYNKLTGVIV